MQSRQSARATLAKRRAEVAAMFDNVAPRYDLMNDLASLGMARRWRHDVVVALDPQPGETVLDLAAGTGTSSIAIAATGAYVVPTDMSLGMLTEGHRRHTGLDFVAGDALSLPFADSSFDAATISFGLRNVADTSTALAELLRVVRPGGRLVICEFSSPTFRPWRSVYRRYLPVVVPTLGRLASSNPDAYEYLVESIVAWPDQAQLAQLMNDAGWSDVEYRNLAGGVVALHRGWRAA